MMLSIEQCKKKIKSNNFTDQEIEEIRDSLYQLADILVTDFINQEINENCKDEL